MSNSAAWHGLLLLCVTPLCAGAQQDGGVRELSSGPEDRLLAWSFHEKARLGNAADGSGDFFRVFPWTVAADDRGRVYVLDVGDFRVAIFDSTGRHIADLGGKGGGPGEFLQPAGISVAHDGMVLVLDAAKGALVRFDSGGRILEQVRLAARSAAVGAGYGEVLLGEGASPLQQTRLVSLRDSTRHVIAEVSQTSRPVQFRGCRMRVPAEPLFAPRIVWASTLGTTVVNDTAAYRVAVWRNGDRVMIVRRDVPPVPVTRADALKSPAVRKGYTVRWPGGSCQVSPEDLLDARGYASTISPIERIAVAPDGSFWIQRRTEVGGGFRTDVFDARATYLGTLPPTLPFPSAFLTPMQPVVVRYDHDGVPEVVLFGIVRR
jgi:hypothetical protein